jgi:hypothetical protein
MAYEFDAQTLLVKLNGLQKLLWLLFVQAGNHYSHRQHSHIGNDYMGYVLHHYNSRFEVLLLYPSHGREPHPLSHSR